MTTADTASFDRVWPHGVSPELAPIDQLCQWFDDVPERFDEFRARCRTDLAGQAERIAHIRARVEDR